MESISLKFNTKARSAEVWNFNEDRPRGCYVVNMPTTSIFVCSQEVFVGFEWLLFVVCLTLGASD